MEQYTCVICISSDWSSNDSVSIITIRFYSVV